MRDPASYQTKSGQSFLGVLARSIGVADEHIGALVRIDGMGPAHGLMGRDPVPAAIVSHLQPCLNGLVFEAHRMLSPEDRKDDDVPTALVLARSVIWRAVAGRGTHDIAEDIIAADTMLKPVSGNDEHEKMVAQFAWMLPVKIQCFVRDAHTVQSLLARLVGITRVQLMEQGLGRTTASMMLNGREDWHDTRLPYLVERIEEFAYKIIALDLNMMDDDADLEDDQIEGLDALSQAETATLWMLWPRHRPFVERYSPHIYETSRNLPRRVPTQGEYQ